MPWRRIQIFRRSRSPFWSRYALQAPLPWVDLRTILNRQRKYLYFRIPKAANSTVVASLYANDTGRVVDGSDDDALRHAKNRFYAHPSALSRNEVDSLDLYTAFTIVREPVSRLVSAYRDKILKGKPQAMQVYRYLRRKPPQDISLDEFVDFLEHGGLLGDPHWMPQARFLPGGFRPLDEIGRVETLADDLPRIFSRLYPQGFRLVDCRPHATRAEKAEIHAALAARIRTLYAEDYKIFGYHA